MIFLIHYDRRAGSIKAFESFDDTDRQKAESARLALELSEPDRSDNEVVLLEAQSETDLRRTHRRYFSTARELARSAADDATTSSTKAS